MSTMPGWPEKTNSFLLRAEVMKDVPPPHQDTMNNRSPQTPKPKRQIKKKVDRKTWYGWLQGWWQGKRRVNACIDVRETGKLRVNLHVMVYERGKWPYFRPEYRVDELTINIPTSMISDIHKEITQYYGKRARKLPTHSWTKKRYAR